MFELYEIGIARQEAAPLDRKAAEAWRFRHVKSREYQPLSAILGSAIRVLRNVFRAKKPVDLSANRYLPYQARGESERAVGALEEGARLLPRVDNVSHAAWIRAERVRYWLAAGNLVQILALQATARQLQGDLEGAVAALARALKMAEPEGFVRTFIDEAQPMAELLREVASEGIAAQRTAGYVAKLLAAYGEKGAPAEPTAPAAQPLVEPLSERELEVLRLLAEGLTNREIAEQLTVTLGTAKTHVSHIYGKLDVHSRTQAVARARELGLVEQ